VLTVRLRRRENAEQVIRSITPCVKVEDVFPGDPDVAVFVVVPEGDEKAALLRLQAAEPVEIAHTTARRVIV
jgi:hypothetical protein